MGLWKIVGAHSGKANLCGSTPQTTGAAAEYSYTGPNPTKDPEIQNADEIPLQGDQAHP